MKNFPHFFHKKRETSSNKKHLEHVEACRGWKTCARRQENKRQIELVGVFSMS